MLIKNLPLKRFPILPLRLVLDGFAAILLWKQNDFSHVVAIFNAHTNFYSNLPKTLSKRRKKPTVNTKSDFTLIRYYLFGKKRYSEFRNQ